MRKRVLSLIIALVFPAVLLCGCSAKQLTGDEYLDEVIAAYKDYGEAIDDWGTYWSANVMTETPERLYDTELQKIREHKSELNKIVNSVEDALDKFDKIGAPPAEPEYVDLDEQMKNAVLIEREWVNLTRRVLSAKSADEYKTAVDNFTSHAEETNEKGIVAVYGKMFMKWGLGGDKDWLGN